MTTPSHFHKVKETHPPKISTKMISPSSKAELRSGKPSAQSFASQKRTPIFVVLDNVTHPYNVGSIFRLADALLVAKLYLCGTTPCPPNSKIKSAARGAERWVPWQKDNRGSDVVDDLKSKGVMVVAAELTSASIKYDTVQYQTPIAVVLGNEKAGVSEPVLAQCDQVVDIPVLGMNNSLSVVSAASIVLYEIYKQIRI